MDRISELPHEILGSILSLLPLKEAVATSVLSRHLRYAWAWSTLTLDFDPEETLIDFKYHSRTLQNKKSHRACFDLDRRFTSSIDKWIEFALKKRVQVLVLDFVKEYGVNKDSYMFPRKLLGLEEGFASRHCVGLKSLKVLSLNFIDVTGEILEHFLSMCPFLERLSVSFVEKLVNLRVVGPSIALKYLKLDECDDLKRVEISNTNLLSFIHTGTAIDLRLSNVPSLVEVAITSQNNDIASLCASTAFMRLAFTQLSCCLYQLETLMINTQEAEYNKDYTFPILPNLKHLELTVEGDYKLSFSQLSFFMKASPYLQRLALKLRFWEHHSNEGKKIKKAAKCPHHYIKVVEVFGYCGRTNAVEHVMFLMENVVALEKLVIVPYWSWDCHHSGSESGKRERKKEAKERRHANMHLKNRVPSTVEFVVVVDLECNRITTTEDIPPIPEPELGDLRGEMTKLLHPNVVGWDRSDEGWFI
ncbi:hypothetical protein L3X38_028092 [Prunus dulcis]|uniref:F-box domain-containing protein n=1 Tax=Prunus dulcis TaxID=3755 RepID=A0AAD4VP08_PRUDU|nr:hypothetical protein L3X38_028092 [Prunus dulcis]